MENVVNSRGTDGAGNVLVAVSGELAQMNAVDRSRLFGTAPELLAVAKFILQRWDLEIAEKGEDVTFPARAIRDVLADAVAKGS